MPIARPVLDVDLLLVGAGIMSATLATLVKRLDSDHRIEIVERLEGPALESSDPWNNAGTGHAGLCELNYTPRTVAGTVDTRKAIAINAQFEVSKQFWAALVERGELGDPGDFIRPVPHLSFVRGGADVEFLRRRFELLRGHHAFADMEYSEDRDRLAAWMPLVMEGRTGDEPLAATRAEHGTDVDFGCLTRRLLARLARDPRVTLAFRSECVGLGRVPGGWRVRIRDLGRGGRRHVVARRVFLGAGGGALPLLQASGIPEAAGYGGFPVSGLWLRCDDPALAERHRAKVYSQAAVGAPPMSVPHLDTRVIDGRPALLFGPFAGFTTRFLKRGSLLDLPRSVRPGNLLPLVAVARDNLDLIRYLVNELFLSPYDRHDALRAFHPLARMRDWRLTVGGQRVQIIKRDPERGGKLEFGTEVVASADGTMSALLGASPGASVAVSAMLDLLGRCFPDEMSSASWRAALARLVRAGSAELAADPALYREVRGRSDRILGLAPGGAAEPSPPVVAGLVSAD